MIIAAQNIKRGTNLIELCGYLSRIPVSHRNDKNLQFSIVEQEMKDGTLVESLYLGPGSLVNHSCTSNAYWPENQQELLIFAKADILADEEITLYYGDGYFLKGE